MNRLKELREDANLTLRALEKKVHIPQATISLIENGKQPFREIHVQKFCKFFSVTPNYLLGVEEPTISKEHMLGAIIKKLTSLNDIELASVYKLIK